MVKPSLTLEVNAVTVFPKTVALETGVGDRATVVEIVIPVLNEERALPGCIRTLYSFLERFPLDWKITVADNGSTDRTVEVARAHCAELDGVQVRSLEIRGRGAALREVWRASSAKVVAYMDVNLS